MRSALPAKGTALKQSPARPRCARRLRFTNDALWFILMMMLIGMCFYVWSVVLLVRMGAKVRRHRVHRLHALQPLL